MPQTRWTLVGPDQRLAFAEIVRPHLELDPVRNTTVLSIVGRLPSDAREPRAEDCYGWWTDDAGHVRAAFAAQVPHAVTLSADVPASAAAELPQAWQDSGRARPSGVFGPVEIAERIAADWAELVGGTYRERPNHAMRLFSFAEPTPPNPAPRGTARLAMLDEVNLATRWDVAFIEECSLVNDGADREPFVRVQIEGGRLLMWTVDGVPVAQAVHTPVIAGIARIVGVYTPPEHRRHGYAASVTWAITHEAMAKGAERVLLHTDLSNPTSNAVYQRLGYRSVYDVTEFELAD